MNLLPPVPRTISNFRADMMAQPPPQVCSVATAMTMFSSSMNKGRFQMDRLIPVSDSKFGASRCSSSVPISTAAMRNCCRRPARLEHENIADVRPIG